MPESDRMLRLAARLAHGRAIDWDREERAAGSEEERIAIQKLRVVAAMSVVSRALMSSAASADLSASISEARVVTGQSAGQPLFDSPKAAASAPALAAGSRWGHLEIEERVGAGAFGEVYRARDPRLDREVALKILGREAADPRAEVVREARLLARIRHPNVVTVHGADRIDGHVGIWTEFLHGQTLDRLLDERGVLDGREAALIGVDLCRALSAVHAAGIVHQDVKLSNVMRAEGGRIVLMDFGLGREWPPSERRRGSWRTLSGTPLFMAPEALRGEPPDLRSDLYSLGVVLFALVTGALPVEAATIDELRSKHAAGERRHARDLRPDLSESFVGFLERALAPNPNDRHQTAGDAESDLLLCFGAPAHSESTGGKRAPGGAADSVPHRLPPEVESFIGRESELGTLAERFERGARLVTLAGIGGIGKTRLAVRYAWENRARWPGGSWFCDLTEASTRDGIASAVGEAIGVPLRTEDVTEQLGRALASRGRCLLILDNFEQIVAQAPETVGRWLELAPETRILVTSRERLQLPGEEVLAIEALPIDEGMDLFVERGRRLRPITLESHEATSVREVVRAVEGIPLAIELAAARLRVMTPAQIVARISERFRLLAGAGSGRHSTLRAAIDSSWELLQPWEKAAFAQAAVFEGGFSLEAAEGVLDLGAWPKAPWIVDVLQSLVDKSLLRSWVLEPRGSNDASPPAMRFGMFVSLQDYARERLAEAGAVPGGGSGPEAVQRAEQRHGQWFARFGEQATIDALDLPSHIGRRALAVEHENLIAACRRMVAQGNGPVAVKNCRAIWVVFQARGPFAPAVELGTTVLQLPLEPADRARMLSLLGQAKHRWGRLDAACADYEAAIAINRARGDRRSEGANLSLLSSVLLNQGKMVETLAMRMSALELHRETGDRRREGILLGNLAISHHVLGRLEEANAELEAALVIAREIGDRHAEGVVLGHLANLRMEQARRDEARGYFETAIAIHREVGNRYFEGVVRGNLGTLCQEQGDLLEAHSHLEAALAIHREVGNRQAEGVVLGQLGNLSLAENRIAEARSRLSEGEGILRSEAAHPYELATLLCSRAELEHRSGRESVAWTTLAEAETLAAKVSQGPETELGRKLAQLRQAWGG